MIFAWLLMMWWAVPGQANPPVGAEFYSKGLDELERGHWAEAAAAFGQAIEEDEDQADFHLARGVARTLAEQFPGGLKDLQRAEKLKGHDWETRLWIAAAYFMNDQAQQASMYFSHGGSDTKEYAEIVHTMARNYMTSRYRGSYYDAARNEQVETREPLRSDFPKAAAAFVRRHRTGETVAAVTDAEARTLYEQGRFSEAFAKLDLLLAKSPDDLKLLEYHAGAALETGNATLAREELTRVLTAEPRHASAYFQRARAAGRMGDIRRARADLDLAAANAAGGAGEFRADPVLAALPPAPPDAGQIPELLAQLTAAAQQDAPWPELLAAARRLVEAVHCHRLRADEAYQDRFRVLLEAAQAIPPSADSLANLGEFLHREAMGLRGEAVEPRAVFQTYRPLTKAQQNDEMARAERSLDAALRADPNHVKALTYKAGCLMWRLQWGEAEAVVRKALGLRPDSPELLEMFAQLMDHAAGVQAAHAAQLRHVETWSTFEYTYWRYPSDAELAQAEEYERQAAELWKLAMRYLEAAAAAGAGTADGFYYQGIIARRTGDLNAARQALEHTVQLAPDRIAARDQLAAVYSALQMPVEACEQQSAANNLVHTTAGPMLRLAWIETQRTARKRARAAAQRAMAIDPADPRAAAYLGVIETDAEKPAEAAAWFRMALALAEVRAVHRGQTLDPAGAGPLSPQDLGLGLAVQSRLAGVLQALSRTDQALNVCHSMVALEKRIPLDQRLEPLVSSMMPDPAMESHTLPEASPAIALMAQAYVELGNAALAAGQLDEAEKAFEAVRTFEGEWPATREGRHHLFTASGYARLGLVKVLAARGRYDEAFRLLTREGLPGDLPQHVRDEARRLQNELAEKRRSG